MPKKKGPPLHPEVEAYWERMKYKSPDAATVTSMRGDAQPIIGRASMEEINRPRKLTQKERDRVTKLYEKWNTKYPSKNRCYEAIALETGKTKHQVRYIIEGPRRSK